MKVIIELDIRREGGISEAVARLVALFATSSATRDRRIAWGEDAPWPSSRGYVTFALTSIRIQSDSDSRSLMEPMTEEDYHQFVMMSCEQLADLRRERKARQNPPKEDV